jgi:mRNA interferase YafQ
MMRRSKDIATLDKVIEKLAVPQPLPIFMRDHSMIGNWAGYRECHIETDWLLIYGYKVVDDGEVILVLVRTGSHADLLDR